MPAQLAPWNGLNYLLRSSQIPGNCSEFVMGVWSKERLLYGVESKAVVGGEEAEVRSI